MTIKALLFNLGNTLVYQNPYKTIKKILGTHGIIKTIEEIEESNKQEVAGVRCISSLKKFSKY